MKNDACQIYFVLWRIEFIRRAVASLTVPSGQAFHFPHFFLKFGSSFLTFPQTVLIFFLILTLRVGKSLTQEGPGYATVYTTAIRRRRRVVSKSQASPGRAQSGQALEFGYGPLIDCVAVVKSRSRVLCRSLTTRISSDMNQSLAA